MVEVSGCGPDLVLIHGWGASAGVWSEVRPFLVARFRVLEIDMPGYGRNVDVLCESFDTLCTRVSQVVPAGAICVGWSLGGLVALKVCSEGRDRRLIMVASSPRFSQAEDWRQAMPVSLLEQFAAGLVDNQALTLRRFVALQFYGLAVPKAVVKKAQLEISRQLLAEGVLKQGLGFLEGQDLRQLYRAYKGEARVVLGGKDRLVPVAVLGDLQALNSAISCVVMPESGHAPFLSHPAAFVGQLAI